jgi:hypothetical protein
MDKIDAESDIIRFWSKDELPIVNQAPKLPQAEPVKKAKEGEASPQLAAGNRKIEFRGA